MKTQLKEVIGDATLPQGDGQKIIAHVVNDRGGFGKGFANAIANRYPKARMAYHDWHEQCQWSGNEKFSLGEIQLVMLDADLVVANMLCQHGYTSKQNPIAIQYVALRKCLKALREEALSYKATVHMPRIGCGLAGGDWDTVRQMIVDELCEHGVEVTVYTLE